MCGIVGLSGSGLERLCVANEGLAHRGPDDSGLFVDRAAGIGLSHRRLAILDLSSAGHQPMASPDDKTVIVFNGEISNFRELPADLETKRIVFRGNSDTEVLLQLYVTEGEAMLSRLNGIFAFAVRDAHQAANVAGQECAGGQTAVLCRTERPVRLRQ